MSATVVTVRGAQAVRRGARSRPSALFGAVEDHDDLGRLAADADTRTALERNPGGRRHLETLFGLIELDVVLAMIAVIRHGDDATVPDVQLSIGVRIDKSQFFWTDRNEELFTRYSLANGG